VALLDHSSLLHKALQLSLGPSHVGHEMALVRCNSSPARQATLPRGSFWRAKLTTSGDLRNFLTRVTTFHDLCMTMTTNGDNILTTLKTNGEDTLTTPFMTHNYLMTTLHDVTDDPCDDIDNLYGIHCPCD
jgi:hypothetical protein